MVYGLGFRILICDVRAPLLERTLAFEQSNFQPLSWGWWWGEGLA